MITNKSKNKNDFGIDKTLIAMFLKMSVEERLSMNENAANAILELRNAYQRRKYDTSRTKLNT
jgi:hypothetical protein